MRRHGQHENPPAPKPATQHGSRLCQIMSKIFKDRIRIEKMKRLEKVGPVEINGNHAAYHCWKHDASPLEETCFDS
jgi:hypothetical protein